MNAQELLEEARDLLPDVVALRRQLHHNPELGLVLPDTQQSVLEAIADLPLEISTGGETSGVVATLRGARPGATVMLRADMDALPMSEDTGLEYASKHQDRMHACGHDAHTAMLVGAARLLARRRESLVGQVKLLFQPGEEGYAGARVMIGEGLLEDAPRVDAAFAMHVDPTLRPGQIALRPGPMLAAGDVFGIRVVGRGGHASMPHHAADPIPAACELVSALQTFVTRNLDAFDPAVISVTQIHAGTTYNVIPPEATLAGTIRSVSKRTRERAEAGLRRVAAGVAAAHGLEVVVHVERGYPVTANDPGFAAFARRVAVELVGEEGVKDMAAPVMGAEDFSYVLEKVQGAFVFLGVRPPGERPAPLHSNRMCLDEDSLATGVALHAAMALRWLELAAGGVPGVEEP